MVISSSILLKEGEFWFVVNCICLATEGYLILDGSSGSMAKVKAML